MKTADRLTPTKDTLNKLFALSGNQCAFPGCKQPLLNEKNRFIGQVCHIVSASKKGERGDSPLTPEQRRHFDNLLILCYPHHIATDDVAEYSVSRLTEMKVVHEERFRNILEGFSYPATVVDEMYRNEMRRMREEVSQTLENTEILKEGVVHNQLAIEQLSGQLNNFMTQMNINAGGVSSDFTEEIDDIMKLRESNDQKAGMIALSQFKTRNWEKLNPHDRFRTIANLGIFSLELNETLEAGNYFVEAYGYEPGNIKAQSIGALGYAIKGIDEQAMALLDEIWKSAPMSTEAWYAFIMIKRETLPFPELLSIVPEEVQNDIEVASGLSLAASLSSNHSQSILFAKTALDKATTNIFDFKASLATCILQSILKPYELLSGQVSVEDKEKVKYIITLYSEAWNEIKDSGLAKSRAWWLINLGVSRKFLPDPTGSYNDMAESCRYNETYHSLRHLAIAALEADKIEEALRITDRMIEIGGQEKLEEVTLFKIELVDKKGESDEALAMIEVFLKGTLEPQNRYHAMIRMLDIYERQGEIETAATVNEDLLNQYPEKIRPYIKKGRYSGDMEFLKVQLDQAYKKVDNQSEPSEVHLLIEWLGRTENYERAATLLEGITNQKVLSDHTKDLLQLYYQAGETNKLLVLTESLLSNYGPTDLLTEYKAVIYQNIGDYKNAIGACREYLEVYPDDQVILTRLGMLYDKDNQPEALSSMLKGIERADQTLPRFVQRNLAQLFYKAGDYATYLKVMYEIRRQFIDDPDAHKEYINGLTKEIPIISHNDPSVVKIDDAVLIRIDGASTETFVFEERSDPSESDGEACLDGPLAKLLMGKKVNDQLTMGTGDVIRQIEILQIETKYRYAFHESMKLLTGKFFQQSGARHFQMGNTGNFLEDFGFFSEMLKEGKEIDKINSERFVKGKIALGSIAVQRKSSVFQVWKDFVEYRGMGVDTTMIIDEHTAAREYLKNGSPIIFDAITIVTIFKIGAMEEITLLDNKKLITRSTYEEITTYLEEQDQIRERGITHIRLEGDKLANRLETSDEVQAEIAALKGLIDWIAVDMTIVPVDAALKINAHEKKKFDDMTGPSFVDSALMAESQNALLVSEERLIRLFWLQQNGVRGLNIAAIFDFLRKSGKISEKKYDLLYEELLKLNYRFIPVECRLLLHYAEIEEFNIGTLFQRACLGLIAPLTPGDQSISITVDFFYSVYQTMSLIFTAESLNKRSALFSTCIDVLKHRFQPMYLENRLLDLTERRLRFLPRELDEVRKIIGMNFRHDTL